MIKIRLYEDRDEEGVIELVLGCQNDGTRPPVTQDKQWDLIDIRRTFFEEGGAFWVAEDNNKVVGCIGLLHRGYGVGLLRKFFVKKELRGAPYHLGIQLYSELLALAKKLRIVRIALDTPKNTERAHRFYEKAGFKIIEKGEMPAMYTPTYPDSEIDYLLLCLKEVE